MLVLGTTRCVALTFALAASSQLVVVPCGREVDLFRSHRVVLFPLVFCIFFGLVQQGLGSDTLPDGFVYLDRVCPSIQVELRYATSNNFVGERVDGYECRRCIMARPAAEALKKIQEELEPFGLGLKVFDAYRPQRAVDHFVRWAGDLQDTKMKALFYPHVRKANLFKEGYIASKSGHSRGSTVDLTIVAKSSTSPGAELDMGSPFDFFSPKSWPDSPEVSTDQRAHRLLLRVIMTEHGFKPYSKEWWHFTLKDEPFPDMYFNFPVR